MSNSNQDQLTPYRIVVGYDYSATADLALRNAFDLAAKEPSAEVHVVHVLGFGGDYIMADDAEAQTGLAKAMNDSVLALEARAEERSSSWQEETKRSFSRLVTHIRGEYPAREVAQLATDLGAQLIVVGTHGRRGFSHFLMGSVAEGVIRLARCAVLVVRPLDTAGEVPAILPPCEHCLEARRASQGKEFWCEQHRERHGQRHTYHYETRNSQPINSPLVVR